MMLLFNADRTIVRALDNGGEYVEKIFVGYSPFPWNAYNSQAREKFRNSSSKEILKKSKYYSKIEIVEGVWDSDEGQRNEIVTKARAQGFDYLIFQDADEFYLPEGWRANLEGIRKHPDAMLYQTPWINFWKQLDFVIESREHMGNRNTTVTTCEAFAMNLKKNPETKLSFARIFPTNDRYRLPGLCYHLSYVMSDEEMYSKIGTWGHSHQVGKNWYKWKWLGWDETTRNINPIDSVEWVKAVRFNGEYPKELVDFERPSQQFVSRSMRESFFMKCSDFVTMLYYQAKGIWRPMRKLINKVKG